MGRRAARKGKSKKPEEEIEIEKTSAEETEQNEEEEEEEIGDGGFFACYLLTSLSPRHKGHTYIGFTVNPRRRIRQHNGEMRSGAWRTKRGRPWEMILCIYGFPSNVSALQFEWHWQHPIESLSVRKAASNFKSLSGIANKIKLAYTMLNLSSWENLNLTVNFFSTKYMKHIGGCPKLPKQMRVNICDMDELPCYVEGQLVDDDNYDESDNEQIKEDSSFSTTSNALVNRIEEVSYLLKKESPRVPESPNFKESTSNEAASITHSCSGEEQASDSNCLRLPSHSPSPSKSSSNDVSIGCLPMSPEFIQKRLSFCIEGEGLRQKSPPRCSSNVKRSMDNQMLSSHDNVIDLETPPSCIVGKRNKRAKVYTEVIDLIDSPFVIEL